MYSKISMPQLSWSKINLFMQCQRCFYKAQVLGKKRPGIDSDSLALNSAAETLLKKEFDVYRQLQKPHPLMIKYNVDAIPFSHDLLAKWRDLRAGGIGFIDEESGLYLLGVVDDIWVTPDGQLIIVDYKSTSERNTLSSSKWNQSYQQQIAYYAGLFKWNGYEVHPIGYLFYSIPSTGKPFFDQQLDFYPKLQACELDDTWLQPTIEQIRECLDESGLPEAATDCEVCMFELN